MSGTIQNKLNTYILDPVAVGIRFALPTAAVGATIAASHSYLNEGNIRSESFNAALLFGAAGFAVGALSTFKAQRAQILEKTTSVRIFLREVHDFGKKGAIAGAVWGIGEQTSSKFFPEDNTSWLFSSVVEPTFNERLTAVGTRALTGYGIGCVVGTFRYLALKAGVKVTIPIKLTDIQKDFSTSRTAKKLSPLLNVMGNAHKRGKQGAAMGAAWGAGIQLTSNPPSMNPTAWSWQDVKEIPQSDQITDIGARAMTGYLFGGVAGTIEHFFDKVL